MLGTAANLSGAFELVKPIIDIIQKNIFPDHDKALSGLDRYLNDLKSTLEKFIEAEKVQHRIDRLQTLDIDSGPSQRAFEDVPTDLQDPSTTGDFKRGQINICGGFLDGLDHREQFSTNFLEEVYYEDPWVGKV